MSPNKERIRLWVDALRSGEYKQGTGQLAKRRLDGGKSYCCLGVASEVSGLPYREDRASLPEPVMDWYGLESSNPMLRESDHAQLFCASVWNDLVGASFNKLADLIEAKYLAGGGDEKGKNT